MSEPAVFPLLKASADVTAIIGTNPVRCFPAGRLRQDPSPLQSNVPAVTWVTVVGLPEVYLKGPPTFDNVRVQVDCWAEDFETALALYRAVRVALEDGGNNVLATYNGEDFDDEVKRFRISADYEFWVRR